MTVTADAATEKSAFDVSLASTVLAESSASTLIRPPEVAVFVTVQTNGLEAVFVVTDVPKLEPEFVE